jgi:glutamate synthase domain-containing protein 1
MCGIAGLIHRGKKSDVGAEMTSMLQALKHRGPDSTGYAVYGAASEGDYIMRFILAEQDAMRKSFDMKDKVAARLEEVEKRLALHGAVIKDREHSTAYALRYVIQHEGDTEVLARHIEDVDGVEILSLGSSLELIKDLGDASVVSAQYGLMDFSGTHGIGHTRMATESDVDIRSAHPYWAFPYNDVSVVHNDYQLLADAPRHGA